MNFQSKTRHESTTCEGVAFTIRTLSQKKRARWGLSVADHLAEQDRLAREMRDLEGDGDVPEENQLKRQALLYRYIGIENAYIKPSVIDLGLVSIEGVTVDGGEADLAGILESVPDELLEEIHAACKQAAGLSEEDSKNLPSPGTSAGQTDGVTSDFSAPPASD